MGSWGTQKRVEGSDGKGTEGRDGKEVREGSAPLRKFLDLPLPALSRQFGVFKLSHTRRLSPWWVVEITIVLHSVTA